ncbi:hypothetical protein TAMA11512_23750 [Selenomonas sp. TAMA-11512]|uniref:hypothetical protein n=1 Tax=Selenomonas sp. TAMA-11512 TaxID=3095337 RepID=UPI00308914E8|nr:hypothetical protein TAMA11512_23750 [Selenomonas sp. TAMA-11512]
MLHRIAACVLGWVLLLALSSPVQAFGLDSIVEEVSSVPNLVYGLYLGQPYKEHIKQCHNLTQGSWETLANGFSGKGDILHPTAFYWCERGPKVREKLQLIQDGETNTLRQIAVIFTSDDSSTTRYIADSLYRNVSDLRMELVEDHYMMDGESSYIEWKMPSWRVEYRARVEYHPADEKGPARAIVVRYVNDEEGALKY